MLLDFSLASEGYPAYGPPRSQVARSLVPPVLGKRPRAPKSPQNRPMDAMHRMALGSRELPYPMLDRRPLDRLKRARGSEQCSRGLDQAKRQ